MTRSLKINCSKKVLLLYNPNSGNVGTIFCSNMLLKPPLHRYTVFACVTIDVTHQARHGPVLPACQSKKTPRTAQPSALWENMFAAWRRICVFWGWSWRRACCTSLTETRVKSCCWMKHQEKWLHDLLYIYMHMSKYCSDSHCSDIRKINSLFCSSEVIVPQTNIKLYLLHGLLCSLYC